MLNEIRFMSTLYRILFFLPFVTSTIAIAWVFRMLYQPRFGLFNVILQLLSLAAAALLAQHAAGAAIGAGAGDMAGHGLRRDYISGGLKQIPRTYYEAAEVDGASRWHTFRYITFPLLNPSIVYLLVLQTISFLRMFAPVVLR